MSSGDFYHEDVEPRFADQPPVTNSMVPPALAPHNGGLHPHGLDGNTSYDDVQSGSRSPADSDRSNFTSVSQRGVNPRWNGGNGGNGYGAPAPMPNRRPPPQRNDILLNNNPDFMLPGGHGPGGRGGGPPRGRGLPGNGIVPSSAYPEGAL